jgi:hypothetical protein
MDELIDNILHIINDYHSHREFHFTRERIIQWVNQFDLIDRIFVLAEFLHLLNQGIYVSETQARNFLVDYLQRLATMYGFKDVPSFLSNARFLRLQIANKSQSILLSLLNEELQERYNLTVDACGQNSSTYAIYIDDLLATGNTLFTDLKVWFEQINADGESNLDKIMNRTIKLSIYHFCNHNANTTLYRLKMNFDMDMIKKVKVDSTYTIQNHLSFNNQRFNFAYPTTPQPQIVVNYLHNLHLHATKNADKALRNQHEPLHETFYSSTANRKRFEDILLIKGIELLQNANELKPNHRPMGAGFPSHGTLGTGTLFFTWRNISNTCPIVFWWAAGGWFPLFPLIGRGQNQVNP